MKRFILIYMFLCCILCSISAQNTFTPIPFTPVPYNPPQNNSNEYLMRSLEQREHRANKAVEAMGELATRISEITAKLYPEENQMAWWKNLSDSIYNKALSNYDIGNYQIAYEYAMNGMHELYDNEISARVRASETYFQFIEGMNQKLARGDISQLTYHYWIASHPYKFVPIFNDEGKIITGRVEGGNTYGFTSYPDAQEIPWETHIYRATEYCKPKKPTIEKIRIFVDEVVPYQHGQPYMEYDATKWYRELLLNILSQSNEDTEQVQQLKDNLSYLDLLLLQDNEYIGAKEYFVRKLYYLCSH